MARRHKIDTDEPKIKLTRENLGEALKIFKFIRPYRWQFFTGLILLLLSSVTFLAFPRLSGETLDAALGDSQYDLSLRLIGIIFIVIFIFQGVVSYTRVILFAIVSENGIADVRKAVYQKVISQPTVFFESSRVGELISRLNSDVERLYNAFSITLAEFLRQVIILVGSVILLATSSLKLALIMLATFPVIVICAMIFGRYIRKLSKKRQNELAETNNILSESLQSIQAVKSFTNELFEVLRYGKSIQSVVKISMKYAHARGLFAVFIVSILFGGLFFVLWQGAIMLQNNEITVGELVAFFTYTMTIGIAIGSLGNFYTELVGAVGATERLREILSNDVEVNIDDAKLPKIEIKGNIEYNKVHFTYPTREDITILKGISFSIGAGEKVALVGPSGAGKSTIIQLLMRFYELDEGSILIDNENIENYNISQLRSNIGIVPQEVILFGGSIEENISYGKPDATSEEIREAARQANALEFIDTFPEGMKTIVGERGIKLSGGQRQRIAIARAILKNPSILLLDEATSSLDAESERLVQEALNVLMEGRTSIIIAHRLATVREVDKIFVIDKGQIIEAGTHEELFAIENGVYNGLAKLQFETI